MCRSELHILDRRKRLQGHTTRQLTVLQNDRVNALTGTKKREIAAERLPRARSTFSKFVMVSVAVSKLGCTGLVFVEPDVKVNGQYYRDVLLSHELLPAIRHIADDMYVF